MEELKPCPFCGSSDVEYTRENSVVSGDYYEHAIECQFCGARGPWNGKSKGMAEKEWNERAYENTDKPVSQCCLNFN